MVETFKHPSYIVPKATVDKSGLVLRVWGQGCDHLDLVSAKLPTLRTFCDLRNGVLMQARSRKYTYDSVHDEPENSKHGHAPVPVTRI